MLEPVDIHFDCVLNNRLLLILIQPRTDPEQLLCAQGKFVYPDGDVYEGQWVNNKAHGEGIHHSKQSKSTAFAISVYIE